MNNTNETTYEIKPAYKGWYLTGITIGLATRKIPILAVYPLALKFPGRYMQSSFTQLPISIDQIDEKYHARRMTENILEAGSYGLGVATANIDKIIEYGFLVKTSLDALLK